MKSYIVLNTRTPTLSIKNNNTVRDLGNLNKEQINYLIDSTIDYATITQYLDLDGMGNMVLYRADKVQPYSYGDLPIIRNKLGPNEKKVFNESLFKGLGVFICRKICNG